ncbi:MAG TPA: TlpA disulfide reductase family protein [Spirochaetales bacterium]|nr:TlpA disulfide reductase family protein [Spirochaetales bacterium]HRY54861.1 TlpA disulfide reductase family protein [Spirochaetia bacterium]HRZ65771.1 TlpA disulfide reductase family protein [Spirochaetia bacterium]
MRHRPGTLHLALALLALPLGLAAAPAAKPWYAERLAALGFQVYSTPLAAPEIELEGLDGKKSKLSDLKGKAVLLNFWATWCPPCRAEMPDIQTLWEKTKDKDFALVALSLGESRQTVADFVAQSGYRLPVYLDPKSRAGGTYGVRSIPTTYIVGKDGRIIAYTVGGREYATPEVLAFFAELASR